MADSASYVVGRQIGRLFKVMPWWGWLIFVLIVLKVMHSIFIVPHKEALELESAPIAQVVDEKKKCESELTQRRHNYSELFAKKDYWAAATEIRACARILKDEVPELSKLVEEAEIKSLLAVINSKKSPDERARAMQTLLRDYPSVGAKYEKEMNALIAKEQKKAELAERKLKKSQGVSIGMSPDDVYASSWGKPVDVNRTTTARGVREQWVYEGGYLYFENGILTAIQN